MQKRFAMLLLLALALALSAPALAATRTGDWAYNVKEDGTASIAGYIGYDGTVVIPSEIDGHPVTEIEDFVFLCGNTLEDVTVPGSVKRIGSNSFSNMEKLRRVVLEEGVEIIDGGAFNLSPLEEIVLPDSLTALGDGALSYCASLSRIHIGAGLTQMGVNPFEGDAAVTEVTVSPDNPVMRMDGALLFAGDRLAGYFPTADGGGQETLVVPEGTRALGASLMVRNKDVKRVVLPEGLEAIGDSAFAECSNLTQINLPGSLKRIGAWAFFACESLAEVTLPDGLEEIGANAFDLCESLDALSIPASVTRLGDPNDPGPVFDEHTLLTVAPGSAAEAYALEEGLAVEGGD